MARSITEIQQSIKDSIAGNAVLAPLLTSISGTALWNLITYVFAVAGWALENLHDLFKSDVNEIILEMKPHSPRWYVNHAKKFQYGFNLVPEKDYYDNTGIPEDVVEASKIVKYAACVELPYIRLKVAKTVGTGLGKLSAPELAAFIAYIVETKDAGVKLRDANINGPATITSTDPDNLRLVLRVKFNPLVLNATGARIDGTDPTPVPKAIRAYLGNIDFNGLFSTQKLEKEILAVDGVTDMKIDGIQKKYGALPYSTVDIDFVPDSGYLIIDDVDLIITYLPA